MIHSLLQHWRGVIDATLLCGRDQHLRHGGQKYRRYDVKAGRAGSTQPRKKEWQDA